MDQSIEDCHAPKKPNNDFIAMIMRDVPIAFFISKPEKKMSAGTIRNPPPAPTRPVTIPTRKPSSMIFKKFI